MAFLMNTLKSMLRCIRELDNRRNNIIDMSGHPFKRYQCTQTARNLSRKSVCNRKYASQTSQIAPR